MDFFACFFAGGILALSMVCMHQDSFGSREAYAEYIRSEAGWIDIPWWVWIVPAVAAFLVLLRLHIKYLFTRVEKEEPWDPTKN